MGMWELIRQVLYFDCLKFSITKTFLKIITSSFIDELNEVKKKKIKVPRIVLYYSGWRSNTRSKRAGHFLTIAMPKCLASLVQRKPLWFLS